jgi:hypothetical protein
MKAKLLTPDSINYYHNQHEVLFDLIVSRDANEANKLIKNICYGLQYNLVKP